MAGKKHLLIIFAVIWAGIIAYNYSNFTAPRQVKTSDANKAAAKGGHGSFRPESLRIMTELLKKPAYAYKGVKRDIFSPLKMPSPVKEGPNAPQDPPPPSQLQALASQIKFVGFLEKSENRTVFLSRGSDIIMVKKGDLIDGRFRVAEITNAIMTVKDETTGENVTLEMEAR